MTCYSSQIIPFFSFHLAVTQFLIRLRDYNLYNNSENINWIMHLPHLRKSVMLKEILNKDNYYNYFIVVIYTVSQFQKACRPG